MLREDSLILSGNIMELGLQEVLKEEVELAKQSLAQLPATNKIQLRFDASSLTKSSCLLRWKRIVIDGITEREKYNDTFYGSAFHKFVASMYETNGDFSVSIKAAVEVFNRHNTVRKGKYHLDQVHLQKTCIDYWQHFQSKDDFEIFSINGKPAVEVDFHILYYEDDQYQVYLDGTIDKLGKFKNGMPAFGDYKTHSLFSAVTKAGNTRYVDENIKTFMKQFELSVQLNFYYFILKWESLNHPTSALGSIFNGKFGAFIDGVFLSTKDPTKFIRSDVITNFNYEEFKYLVDLRVKQLIQLTTAVEYTTRDGLINGACVDGKYTCPFHGVCNCTDEVARKMMLQNNFITKPFNPLEYSK